MPDDPAPLLLRAGQEAGHVDEGDERDVERVAGPHEARRLHRGVDVEHAGQRVRLVADDADGMAAEAREAADDVLRVVRPAARGSRRRRRPRSTTRLMSYGLLAESGMSVSSSGASRSTGSAGAAYGGVSRLFCGRNERR